MLHSSVKSASRFEQAFPLNASLSFACTHLFSPLRQPIDSQPLAYSFKNIGGVPLFVPFWNASARKPNQSPRGSSVRLECLNAENPAAYPQSQQTFYNHILARPARANYLESHSYAKTPRGVGLAPPLVPLTSLLTQRYCLQSN